jgi:RNA polymerase primary sigma factor
MSKNFINSYSEDCIGHYFKEVRKTRLLTPEEEVSLAIRIQEGDTSAVEELVMCNVKFVISIAKEYQGQGLSLNDLINEGNYGLIRAALKFDATRGFRFISYAVWWVKQSIMQSLNDNSRMVRLPANVLAKLKKIDEKIREFEFNNEREPIMGEVLNEGTMGEDNEELTIMDTPKVISLNSYVNDDGTELGELISDPITHEEPFYLIDARLKEELNKTLSSLKPRERDIIESYFGVNIETESLTLEDIGDKYGLTKERIRQIKEKAIRKLRHNGGRLFELLGD